MLRSESESIHVKTSTGVFACTKLDANDWAAFEAEALERFEAEKQKLIGLIADGFRKGGLGPDAFAERLAQIAGAVMDPRELGAAIWAQRFVLWLSLRHKHPEMTLEEAGALINPRTRAFVEVLNFVSGYFFAKRGV